MIRSGILACFNCRNWRPSAPNWDDRPKWSPPSYATDRKFDMDELHGYCREHGLAPSAKDGWPGLCLFEPIAKVVYSVHVCAQHAVNPDLVKGWYEWRKADEVYHENSRLREQLKAQTRLKQGYHHDIQILKARLRVAEGATKLLPAPSFLRDDEAVEPPP